MIQKMRDKISGNSAEIAKLLVIGSVIIWMFCQVRDIPATYATKAELNRSLTQMKGDQEKQFDRIFQKLNDIESFLREKK